MALPELTLSGVALGVILDRLLGVVRRIFREQLGSEEPRVHDRRVDAEWLHLGRERCHPTVDSELRCSVGRAVLEAAERRCRRDRHDVSGTLLAHDWQEDRKSTRLNSSHANISY